MVHFSELVVAMAAAVDFEQFVAAVAAAVIVKVMFMPGIILVPV